MKYSISAFLVAAGFPILVSAESFEVGQTDKQFTKSNLEIKVGDTVKFTNNDSFFHNVFSLSDIQMFDLGSYQKGESREVVFETLGEVEVECAIHPDMHMTIKVKE
jgi:plastocyanin